MDKEAVDAAISIFKRMDKDKSKRYQSCRNHGVNCIRKYALSKTRPRAHEVGYIFGSWTYEVNNFSVVGRCLPNIILEISPILGCVARVNDLVLKRDQICFG